MPTMTPFEGAKDENNEQKRELLNVIAQSGVAGKQAYEDAKAQAGTMRQNALGAAGQRAQMTGQNLGGADTAPVTEAADRYGTYFGGQQANYQNLLGTIGSSADSYLSKVNAIQPFMQNQNSMAASDRENQYRAAIAKAEADRAFTAEQARLGREHDMNMLNRRGVLDANSASASRAQTAREAADPSKLTKGELLGAGQTLSDQYAGFTGMTPGSQGTFGADPSARALAAYRGVNENIVNTILGPRETVPTAAPTIPRPFDKSWVMQNVTMPGTDKKATDKRAQDVVNAPEVQAAANQWIPNLLELDRQDGRITDPDAGEFRGKTLREAFETYVRSNPGILTMKDALIQYYGPFLDSIK